MSWSIRSAGTPAKKEYTGPDRILIGLRDGDIDISDEVMGPDDKNWQPLEDHPTFAEACENLIEPPAERPDESHIDMNPMIDVALVLLIFFILTTTYSSLRRSMDLPEAPTDKKGAPKQQAKPPDIKERIFKIKMYMEDDKPIVKLDDKVINFDDVETEMTNHMRNSGRREMLADIDAAVPWGMEAKLLDAARGANVLQIYWPKKK